MAEDNMPAKYTRYAIGEVILLVVGILIALQINNWSEQAKERAREVHYLENIKSDLYLNIAEIDRYIATRTKAIESANIILEHFEGKPLIDIAEFNEQHYKIMKDQEDHFRYDAEVLLYEPAYGMSNEQAGEDLEFPVEPYERMLKDIKQKNGFVMAVYEFSTMNVRLEQMKAICQNLTSLIDKEISI